MLIIRFLVLLVFLVLFAIMLNADRIDERLSRKFRPFRRRRYMRKLYEFRNKYGYSPYFADMKNYLERIGETYLLEK